MARRAAKLRLASRKIKPLQRRTQAAQITQNVDIFNDTASREELIRRGKKLKAKYGNDNPEVQRWLRNAIARYRARQQSPTPQKQKRTDTYRSNVAGIFNRGANNVTFQERVAALQAKYGADVANRIERAKYVRTLPYDAEKARKRELKRRGAIGSWGAYPVEAPQKNAQPSGPCVAESSEGKNPFTQPCWSEALQRNPKLQGLLQAVKSGQWLCDAGDTLGAHQLVTLEAAKIIAAGSRVPHAPTDRRGLLVYQNTGAGKCHAIDTNILTYHGFFKKVQDIQVGDLLMGDDGTPRTVLSLARGREEMYDIVPTKKKAETWGCNESHILVLNFTRHKCITRTPNNTHCLHWHAGNGQFKTKNFKTVREAMACMEDIPDELAIVELEIREYLKLGSHIRHVLKMFRTGVDFPDPQEPCFDPYVLGAWLGDGTSRSTTFCICEEPLVNELEQRLKASGMELSPVASNGAPMYNAVSTSTRGKSGGNPLRNSLVSEGMMGKGAKHVPHHIKTGTRKTRLEVLAGLLDTDGFYGTGCYEIIQKNEVLANDIVFVARSLGFAAYVAPCQKGCTYKGAYREGTYYRITISGSGLEDIPVVLERKKVKPRNQIKDALRYGFDVVPKGEGDFYGFTLDGNHRYLLGDFTVTHNTVTAMGIIAAYWNSGKDIFFVTTIANSNGNPASEYAKNALVFYPDYAGTIFKDAAWMPKQPWTVKAYKESRASDPKSFRSWCASVGGPIIEKKLGGPKGVGQLACSFWRFAGASADRGLEKLKSPKGAVLIVDEAQNFFKSNSAGNEQLALQRLTTALKKPQYMTNSDVYLLTATPGDTAQQMMDMLNYVRPHGMAPLTVRDFVANSHLAKGLVSYADVRGDPTHYGALVGGKPINKYFAFHPAYYKVYLAEFGSTYEKNVRNLNAEPDKSKKFFIKSIVGGCMLNKSLFGKDKDQATAGMLASKVNGSRDVVFSEKMKAALEYVARTKGCQYMFVPDVNVLKAVVWVMQNHFKFARVDGTKLPKRLEETEKGKERKPYVPDTNRTDALRFYAFHPGIMDGAAQTPDEMKAVLDWFKSPGNENGNQIRLFVGTTYEGLDMSYLQAVHLTAPLATVPDDDQAVGRALRYCGHKPVAKEVAVFRYFSVAPRAQQNIEGSTKQQQGKIERGLEQLAEVNERGANVHVFADALRRGRPLNEFAMCVRGQAIECAANPEDGGILGPLQFGQRTRCNVPRCEVKLDAKGDLAVPKHTPGKHAHGPLPSTIHDRPGIPGGGVPSALLGKRKTRKVSGVAPGPRSPGGGLMHGQHRPHHARQPQRQPHRHMHIPHPPTPEKKNNIYRTITYKNESLTPRKEKTYRPSPGVTMWLQRLQHML
jgi:hypothetical protein